MFVELADGRFLDEFNAKGARSRHFISFEQRSPSDGSNFNFKNTEKKRIKQKTKIFFHEFVFSFS